MTRTKEFVPRFRPRVFFENAVAEAKEILRQFESGQMRLGDG